MKAAITILLALGLCALSGFAQAQSRGVDLPAQLDRVEREFERTDAVLERIAPMVQESNVPRPRELFERAAALQEQGHKRLDNARTAQAENRPVISAELARNALGLTLQAREMAQRAGAMLREEVGFEERARRAIEELERRIERARDREPVDDSRDAALLAEAIQQLESARKHFADHNFEVAYRIADSALRLLDGAGSLDDRGRPGAERLREELLRTQEFYQRAREQAGELDNPQRRALERAGQLVAEAERALQGHDGRRAHRQLQEAQRLLRELMQQRKPGADDVERAMARVDAALQRLLDERQDLPQESLDLIERATQERAAARQAFDAQDHDRALTHLRAALDLLDRARRAGGRD